MDISKWINSKKVAINSKNNDGDHFQYVIATVLNNEKAARGSQRTAKDCPLIDQYEWKDRFPCTRKGLEKV